MWSVIQVWVVGEGDTVIQVGVVVRGAVIQVGVVGEGDTVIQVGVVVSDTGGGCG